ncbi:hypothetical protein T492DRAFT_845079 [Pavlovales sp. CCMP2436]|nr:hypothetical protein T492DRAFT_845079 [Pavlovales sp. CCMP2436]
MLVLAICFCARPRPCDGPIAIFPPVPSITTFCSIGDRAIVVSALHEVRRRCPNAATVVVGKVLPVAGINFTTVTIKRWHQGVAQEASAIIVLATDMLDGRWGGNRFEVSMLNIAQAADARGTPFAAISFTYASSVNAVHSIEHFPASSCLRPRSSASCVDVRSRIEAEAGTATNCSYPVLKTASALRSAHLRHTMDLAFLLPQTSPPAGDKAWLDDQLRSGVRTVLGVNLFVYPSIRKTGFQKLAQRAAHETLGFKRVSESRGSTTYAGELCAAHQTNHLLSVLLVAHDFRKRMGKDYEHEFAEPAPFHGGGCYLLPPATIPNEGSLAGRTG